MSDPSNSESSERRKYLKPGEINREKTCPLLMRVFCKVGGHHNPEEYDRRGREPPEEVQIYTWKDATLRELTGLIMGVNSAARRRDARLAFAFVYPDKLGRMVLREVGQTWAYNDGRKARESTDGRKDDQKTLDELHFETGDFLDVAIYVNG